MNDDMWQTMYAFLAEINQRLQRVEHLLESQRQELRDKGVYVNVSQVGQGAQVGQAALGKDISEDAHEAPQTAPH